MKLAVPIGRIYHYMMQYERELVRNVYTMLESDNAIFTVEECGSTLKVPQEITQFVETFCVATATHCKI